MANPFPFMQAAGPMMAGGPMPPPPPPMSAGMPVPGGLMGPTQMAQPTIGPQAMPPGMISMLDPATNNQPLQFNTNKGKPPMPVMGEMQEVEQRVMLSGGRPDRVMRDRDRNDRDYDRDRERSRSSDSMPLVGRSSPSVDGGNMDGNGMMGMMPNMMGGPMGYGPMMSTMSGDPNMMMMGPMGNMGFNQFSGFGMGMGMNDVPSSQKEIIRLKGAVLYPPPPNAPPPTTRERPPGCRTIFVGGLPENIKEEILREMFENCGAICSIRISKKNFAHIRFEQEESVEKSLYLSGYRMKIDDKDDKPNTGRIHVDYAQARDDLYEWECKQRALAREMRHRSRLEEERLRPPSPPPIIHYSDHEASLLMEKLKADDSFMKATQVLVTWLERGDCARRSANTFYSMIQSVNSHVRRLMNEKGAHDQELEQMKLAFRQRHEGILRQFEQIEKVFTTASKQKSWDHFSKAQRKNLDMWRKQAEEIRQINQEEFLRDRQEDEMEMSDNEEEGPAPKKSRKPDEPGFNMEMVQNIAQITRLQEENDNMKCQLEAYKNEIELTKKEQDNSGENKDKQIKVLQQALQGMQQQLMTFRSQSKKDEKEIARLKKEVKAAATSGTNKEGEGDDDDKSGKEQAETTSTSVATSSVEKAPLNDKDARLVGILSTFLWVHPFGASLDYIWSYLQRLDIQIRTSEIEDLLERMPSVFKQDLMGVGASLEKRWKFVGFESPFSF